MVRPVLARQKPVDKLGEELDLSRMVFLGRVPHDTYLAVPHHGRHPVILQLHGVAWGGCKVLGARPSGLGCAA